MEDLFEKYMYKIFDLPIRRKYKIHWELESVKVSEYGRNVYVASPFELNYMNFLIDKYPQYNPPKDFSVITHQSSGGGVLMSFTFTVVNDDNSENAADKRQKLVNTWVGFKYISTDEDGSKIYELDSFSGNIFKKSKLFFDSVIAFMDHTFEVVE